MNSEDDPSRRGTLITLAAAALTGCSGGTAMDGECGGRTGRQTEGPFYPGEPVARVDITEGLAGVRVMLDIRVVAKGTCDPIAGAEVDVWSADVDGDYSGYDNFDSEGEDWMRGQQVTDANGVAAFEAIVPGAYPGRAVHIHVKVRADGRSELTTQVYFPDALVADVLAQSEYANSAPQVANGDDGFYASDTLMTVTGDVSSAVSAVIDLVV